MEKRDWLLCLTSILKEFACSEFQERVWLRGEGPEVSSYDEAVSRFLDDFASDDFVSTEWKQFLTEDQSKTLMKFWSDLKSFDDSVILNENPVVIIEDYRWPAIRRIAQEALDALSKA